MKKIFVTGGAGFIGSNFIKYILAHYQEYQVINLDKLTYAANHELLKQFEETPQYEFVKGSITDHEIVEGVLREGIDFVVNFAAESHVDRSIETPSVFVETNVLGTQVLLEAAHKHGVEKFIQISTDEVYGSLGDTGYFSETSPIAPNSPYSASKASADMLVRAYYETFNLPVNITRCSNNYGPYQNKEKLIPKIINNALNNKAIPVYGTGENIRDWLYVEDHCEAIDRVIHEGKVGEVYNIGGNCELQNIDLVKLILSKLDKPYELIGYVKDRLGHDKRYAIDHSKITSELGWRPSHSFEDGLRKTLDWYTKRI